MLPKVHSSEWSHHRGYLGHEDLFYQVLLCNFATSSFAFVRSIPFLSFIELIFAWNVPLISLIFLKRSLVFPILLFFSISLHWLLRKAFLSLLAILWNSASKWVYLFFSPLLLASLLFTAICKASWRTYSNGKVVSLSSVIIEKWSLQKVKYLTQIHIAVK